jgi:PAS domain S-box-containing protein
MTNSPPRTEMIDDQTPLYSSGVLSNYVSYLQTHNSDVDIDDLLHCSGLSRFDINDKGYFFSQAQVNRFHACLDERLADPQISYKVGQHALYAKSSGIMKQFGLQFVTPAKLYKALDHLYPKWSKGHVAKTLLTGKDQVEITVSQRPGVHEKPFQCQNRIGIFQAMANLQTGQTARITHPECIHSGDDVCLYHIAWKNTSSTLWKRRGAYVSLGALIFAVAAPFFIPATWWAFGVMAMGIACLAIFLFANDLEKKELTGFLKEQGDMAGQLLEENEARYQKSRLIQEVGRAGVHILEVGSFLDTVLASMSRNLDFTRGIILLCEDNCRRMRCAAHYGCSQPEQQFLSQINFEIDLEDSADMFIQALRFEKPIFLNDIQAEKEKMAAGSVAMLERLRVESLIGVPLVYKKEPLGLLFVDTQGVKKEHTTSDVNMLIGIAAQVAAGIVNARSYEKLQESERRYRLLAENAADVIWILDIDTLSMKYVNRSVEKTLGYTPEEFMGMTIDQYLTPESFKDAADALEETFHLAETGRIDPANYAKTLVLEERHKDGSIIPVEVIAGLLVDSSGSPGSVLGISRDLSDRRKAEQERVNMENRLRQAQKMESLGTMAGSIAHNFNNLLMVVLGNLELIKEDLEQKSIPVKNVLRAINASQRAAELSNMMLTYVGQLKKESLPVDLSQLVIAEVKKLDEDETAHATLDLDLADPMPLVAADRDQMRQMISGFITNAVESLEGEKGRIRISTGAMHCDAKYLAATYLKEDLPEGTYAYVKIADTGCGMDSETLAKVFDPFFSTKFTGRGLGLAAVMGIIRAHFGTVRVHSRKGEGSTFTALFPIQGISLGQPPKDRKEQAPADKKTVLLVDDEPMVAEIGRQFLERLGYGVKTAFSGREALAALHPPDHGIDCVLLDFTMPGMDGLETMQKVREVEPEARIIISSGYTRQQIEECFAGVDPPDGFIHKPFEMKALQKKLDIVLTEPH